MDLGGLVDRNARPILPVNVRQEYREHRRDFLSRWLTYWKTLLGSELARCIVLPYLPIAFVAAIGGNSASGAWSSAMSRLAQRKRSWMCSCATSAEQKL